MENLPYEHIRWIKALPEGMAEANDLTLSSDTRIVQDIKGNKLLLFSSEWNIDWAMNHNKGLVLAEFSENE